MVPFGFSVGDFIRGVDLLIDVVHSLSDTHGAQADYKEIESELHSLNNGLDSVRSLTQESSNETEISAVIAAVDKCRACVEDFVRRNRKFKSLESTTGKKWTLAALKKSGRAIQ